jgi:hypothetical protein
MGTSRGNEGIAQQWKVMCEGRKSPITALPINLDESTNLVVNMDQLRSD